DAQGNELWSRAVGRSTDEYARLLRAHPLYGYFTLGYSTSGAGSTDFLLSRYDSTGAQLWANTYGNINQELPVGFRVAANTDLLICGRRAGYLANNDQGFLTRLDSAGAVLWAREYSGSGLDRFDDLLELPGGDLMVVGSSTSAGAGGRDLLLLRTDSAGTVLWSRVYGGANDEVAYALKATPDGGYMLFGTTQSFGQGAIDLLVTKVDSVGNWLWSRALGGANDDRFTFTFDQPGIVTPDGGALITASTASFGFGNRDIYLARVSAFGVGGCQTGGADAEQDTISLPTATLNWVVSAQTLTNTLINLADTNPAPQDTLLCQITLPDINCLQVDSSQKVSDTQGGFLAVLNNIDQLGANVKPLGDFNGDGVPDLMVAANLDDDGGINNGAFYLVYLNQDGTVSGFDKISDTQGGFTGNIDEAFGKGLAVIGDLNNDGVTDIAVGEPNSNDGGIRKGAVWILFMNANGTVASHQKISDLQGGFTGVLSNDDRFGNILAGIGDVNNDGVPDLAVGAVFDDDGGLNRGAVWILFMNANGTVQAHQKISGTQGNFTGTLDAFDTFGSSVSDLGDLNGDGVPDIAVGAERDDDGGLDHGAIWILFLNANGTVNSHQKISDTQGGFTGVLDLADGFGRGLANLGDLDGDGVVDLAAGAVADDDGGGNRGAVWVLFLNSNGTVNSHQKISDLEGCFTGVLADFDVFGTDLEAIGDHNQDGITDLLVSARGDNTGGAAVGAAYVLYLRKDGTVRWHEKYTTNTPQMAGYLDVLDWWGFSVAHLGDLNGDGATEFAIAALQDDDGGTNTGAFYVLFHQDTCVSNPYECEASQPSFVRTFGGNAADQGHSLCETFDGGGILAIFCQNWDESAYNPTVKDSININ
ncbi:MAG: VCBS repeat-containing protein, partial [Bacteroidota bacterium]